MFGMSANSASIGRRFIADVLLITQWRILAVKLSEELTFAAADGVLVPQTRSSAWKTHRRHLSFPVMALAPGLALAEVAGSAFCLLSPSPRLLSFTAPILPPLPPPCG